MWYECLHCESDHGLDLTQHALACGGRCCAEREWRKRIDILDHNLKPWQATSSEPWQAMIERHRGSGTGCTAVQRTMGGSCTSSGRLQRAYLWHQRCWNCSCRLPHITPQYLSVFKEKSFMYIFASPPFFTLLDRSLWHGLVAPWFRH